MQDLILKFLGKKWADVQFSPVPKGQNGDLALSFFELAKNTKKSPVALAQEVQPLLAKCDVVEKTQIVGPYLNLFFKNEVFFEHVFQTPVRTHFLFKKSIIVEFSGPNTNKPLHLGHMRNHAIGISLSNLLEAAGAQVHRVNIINDRGVHICKSMIAYQKWGKGETPESTGEKSDHFVGRYYVKFEQELKNDPPLKDEIQAMLVKWEEGDKAVKSLWQKMNDWALTGHAETYARQGVSFEKSYFESEMYQLGKEIAEQGVKKKVFQKRADGAIVIDLEKENLGEKVILRADGTSVYVTQDLALASLRKKDFHPDEMIHVVADEQIYHFQVLFACLERLKILSRDKLLHLAYGLVNLPHGRMKSREGTVVDADDLMDELAKLAAEEIKKRNPELKEAAIKRTAEQIMNAAWKFYLLQTNPKKTMLFDPEASIAFEGGTGPYLQYAGVRIKSIFKKATLPPSFGKGGDGGGFFDQGNANSILGDVEKPLGVKILQFPNVLNRAAETKNPTFLVTYLLELAQEWSSFYAANSVLNAENEALRSGRLALAKKVLEILENGLKILGIEIPEVM